MRRPRAAGFACAGALCAALCSRAAEAPADPEPSPREITIDHDDIDVTTDVVVKPGTYRVRDANGDGVLRVKADGVAVTLRDVVLDGAAPGQEPDAFDGVGISVVGRKDVRIDGGAVRGFRVGVRGQDAPGIQLTGADVSGGRAMRLRSTPEREDAADWLWPHENDDGQWERNYGAGISLTRCREARVTRCRARGTQNGLLLSRSDGATATGNDFSFLSGWGIALWRTSGARVSLNRLDFCVRGYSHGVYARGQDSAAILMFEQCSGCAIDLNSGTHSGDGLFLYAGNESLKRTGKGGCNKNMVSQNDFSHAVANGIEATFSSGNSFCMNRLDDCEHGVWAGYSSDSIVCDNEIGGCANGISIEHGRRNEIRGNRIARCGTGVHLWWDEDPDLLTSAWGVAHDTSSSANAIHDNDLEDGSAALLLDRDRDSTVKRNDVRSFATAFDLRGEVGRLRVEMNDVTGPVSVRAATTSPLSFGPGWWNPWKVEGPQGVTVLPPIDAAPPPRPPPAPVRLEGPYINRRVRQGRERILVGDWGPLDPSLPALFPAKQSTSGAAAVHVLGDGKTFKVTSLTDGFLAEPREGTAPAVVRVTRAAQAGAASVAPFVLKVRVGEEEKEARGTLLSTRWKVRFWKWEKDPRTDPAAHAALLATEPLDTLETDRLDFAWGGGAPTPKVPADRFATVAETTVTLPEGKWRLVTTSDDGIRVLLDGKVVLEDWTWHAPTERAADLLSDGKPHAIRVEHFEIDGWAALRCSLRQLQAR